MLLRVLSPEMRQILSRPIFTFHIPNEFRGNDESPKSVTQSILMSNLPHGQKLWRFRADIICGDDDGKHCPKGMCEVKHLQKLLRNPSLSIRLRLCPGTILFMDNGSYLHARSNIQDSSRWLKRVRFYMEGGR
uniref:TauD/TfdA-like domain-containing protein n=1 Tax=Ditylum brightwellii TaxID=49249 RepID=A0A7S1ZL92_9STRA